MDEGSAESIALGIALAGGAILATLLDDLRSKGVLSNNDVHAILQRASSGLMAFGETQIGREGLRAVSGLLTRFPEEQPTPGTG